jgi:hypothetical protein
LRRDRRELGIQFGAKAVHNRDDCDRNASGDKAILDGGRARVVGQELAELCKHGAQYQAEE